LGAVPDDRQDGRGEQVLAVILLGQIGDMLSGAWADLQIPNADLHT
jgi:hypothetical protein